MSPEFEAIRPLFEVVVALAVVLSALYIAGMLWLLWRYR